MRISDWSSDVCSSDLFTIFAGMCWSPNGPESVSLASLPLFHVTGMQNSMNMLVFQGSTMVMMSRWNRRTAAELIARHRVTHWRCITTMAVDLLSDPDAAGLDRKRTRLNSSH